MVCLSRALAVAATLLTLYACGSDESVANLDASAGDGGVGDPDAAAGAADAGLAVDAGSSPADGSVAGPDAGAPLNDLCDPVTQTMCVAPTTKCVVENPTPGGGTLCVEPGNDVALGGMCTGADCVAGLACVGAATGSVCMQVCDFQGDGSGCEPLGNEWECRTRLTGTNWGACTELPPLCDYLTQDPCAADRACGPLLRRTGQYEFRCRAAGTQGEGASCGSSGGGDCQRELVCVRDPRTNQAACKRYCDTNDDCTAPQTCAGSVSDPAFMYCDN